MARGTSQDDRFPAALEDGYFLVDEFRFEQLVSMSAALAQRLRFVDVTLRDAGHWGALFAADESMVLARIAATDRNALQSNFLRLADSAPLPQLAHEVVRLGQWLDLWFKSLAGSAMPAAHALRERLAQLVEQELAEPVQWVYQRFSADQWGDRPISHGHARLDPMWQLSGSARAPLADGPSDRERLRRTYFTLLSALARLQPLARELLPQTLAIPTHEPAAGLLIAFLQVYASVQQQINRFSDHHVDFYYQRVLGLKPRDAEPDTVHVVARRDTRGTDDVMLPPGLMLRAGKDAQGRPVELRSQDALAVTAARVALLLTIKLERDPLISPEREFGFVTRVKATRIPPPRPGQPPDVAWPLFGGGQAGTPTAAEDARLGMALASPLLALAEGERDVALRLAFAETRQDFPALVRQAVAATAADDFFVALGPVLRAWLFAEADPLTAPLLDSLRQRARTLLGADTPAPQDVGDPLGLLAAIGNGDPARAPSRDLVFDRLLGGLFDVSLTTPTGWLTVPALVQRAPAAAGAAGGLTLTLKLRPEDPAVVGCLPEVHGAEWPTRLPVLRLLLGARGRTNGYSLFATLPLVEAGLRVQVRGLRRISVFNQLGRLDATKPFAPFGPLPTLSSYLVFGAEEAARKPVRELALHVEWGGLPTAWGGFASHYAGYRDDVGQRPFMATMSVLRDGQWLAVAAPEGLPLFEPPDAGQHLVATRSLRADPAALLRNVRAEADALPFDGGARHGHYRLQLVAPNGAFGHAQYPTLLAEVISANARRKRPAPLPNPPYTPLIERLSLDYVAGATVRPRVRTDTALGAEDAVLLHVHPYGITELKALSDQGAAGLLPQVQNPANLYIGLEGPAPEGPLALMFHLFEERAAEQALGRERPRYEWSLMSEDRWLPLPPQAVLSDTTDGFLSTGIVVLDVPAGATNQSAILPTGLYWLRVSVAGGAPSAAGLYGVHAHAFVAARVLDGGFPATLLPPGTVEGPSRTVPGLAGVTQVGSSRGLRAAENARSFRARAGERLRHKGRASLPWDAERLLLDRFPEVSQVKCFAAQELPPELKLRPGDVLVVVVPALPRNRTELATAAPRIHAGRLQRMQAWLAERASPFARIVVRNAAYERVQVRCSVQVARGASPGAALRGVNRAIVEHLSPWFDSGRPPEFQWTLRADEVESRLRELPEVDAVGGLSLLHVATGADGLDFTLGDTARRGTREENELGARLPWSLALPMRQHMLTLAGDLAGARAQPTGVSRLTVGSTFIVGRST